MKHPKLILLGYGVGAVMVIAAVGLWAFAGADEKAGRRLETEDVMKRNHGKKRGLMPQISALVKDKKFDEAGPLAKKFAEAAADLPRNRTERGDRKTWDELAKDYAESGKDLADAVAKKDADAAKSALSALGGSCKSCHELYRRGDR